MVRGLRIADDWEWAGCCEAVRLINLHQLFTIPQSGIHRFVGSVSESTMCAVRGALLHALAFES